MKILNEMWDGTKNAVAFIAVAVYYFLTWAGTALVDMAISLLSFPVAPISAAASLSKYTRWVCNTLFWPFQTHDNDFDGDGGHWGRWPDNGTRWRVYCRRVAWMWRNRAYRAAYHWFGRDLVGQLREWGRQDVSNRPLRQGISFEFDEAGTWELYLVIKWPFLNRCFRLRLGWKIPEDYVPGKPCRAMICSHVSPLMGVSYS